MVALPNPGVEASEAEIVVVVYGPCVACRRDRRIGPALVRVRLAERGCRRPPDRHDREADADKRLDTYGPAPPDAGAPRRRVVTNAHDSLMSARAPSAHEHRLQQAGA